MTELHIISDGTGLGTSIILPDGRKVTATSAEIRIEKNEPNKVDLVFELPSVDVVANLDEVKLVCPICGVSDTHNCSLVLVSPFELGEGDRYYPDRFLPPPPPKDPVL